jgi:hypothetical protein
LGDPQRLLVALPLSWAASLGSSLGPGLTLRVFAGDSNARLSLSVGILLRLLFPTTRRPCHHPTSCRHFVARPRHGPLHLPPHDPTQTPHLRPPHPLPVAPVSIHLASDRSSRPSRLALPLFFPSLVHTTPRQFSHSSHPPPQTEAHSPSPISRPSHSDIRRCLGIFRPDNISESRRSVPGRKQYGLGSAPSERRRVSSSSGGLGNARAATIFRTDGTDRAGEHV